MLDQKNEILAPVITKIFYQFRNNIQSDGPGSTPGSWIINLYSGYSWKEIKFSPGTADFVQTKKNTDAGDLFEQKLQFSIPGDDSLNFEGLSDLDQMPVVVKFEYSSGLVKLIGTKSVPAEFTDDYSSNRTSTKDILEFFCKATHRAYTL